ncbi:hypothetical protein [Haloplanus natans]|uniref:hypothetical protein n=1 Tax=Haloplanus natans TaxID=376171 RepID=UPI0006778128|nr:hypothetical protein [Haloplanus natans]
MGLFDDKDDEITDKILENQDLDKAAKDLKSKTESELDQGSVNKYNLRDILDRRRSHASQIEDSASTKADLALEKAEDVESRWKEDSFEENLRRNAVDAEDAKKMRKAIRDYRQLVSRLALALKVYKDQDDLLSDAIDLQQMRQDESKVMEMTKEYVSESQNQFQNMSREVVDEVTDSVEDLEKELSENHIELSENMKEAAEALESAAQEMSSPQPEPAAVSTSGSIDTEEEQVSTTPANTSESQDQAVDSEEELSDLNGLQGDLYELVDENPGQDLEWYADELDKQEHIIKGQVTNIQKKGFENFGQQIEGV